jgi:hypothetical protein
MERAGASAALLHRIWPDGGGATLPAPSPRWVHYPLTGPLARIAARLPLPGSLKRSAWSLTLAAAYARGYRRADAFIPATQPEAVGASPERA